MIRSGDTLRLDEIGATGTVMSGFVGLLIFGWIGYLVNGRVGAVVGVGLCLVLVLVGGGSR